MIVNLATYVNNIYSIGTQFGTHLKCTYMQVMYARYTLMCLCKFVTVMSNCLSTIFTQLLRVYVSIMFNTDGDLICIGLLYIRYWSIYTEYHTDSRCKYS